MCFSFYQATPSRKKVEKFETAHFGMADILNVLFEKEVGILGHDSTSSTVPTYLKPCLSRYLSMSVGGNAVSRTPWASNEHLAYSILRRKACCC
jgi:hypothetical protein